MINKTKLPEKSYFSVDKIAERWGCDAETVIHYIYFDCSLRSAVKLSLNHKTLCGIRVKDLHLSKDQDDALAAWHEHIQSGADTKTLINVDRVIQDLPEFLYLIPSNKFFHNQHVSPDGEVTASLLETLEGDYIALLKNEGEGKFTPCDVHVGWLREYEDGFADIEHIISKEERDRFELKNGMVDTQQDEENKEQLSPFNLPPKQPDDAARLMCMQGNILATILGKVPTQTELKNFILKDNDPYTYVELLETGHIDIGNCRVSERGFADRYRKYLKN